jgi:hypothetical protein
MPDYSVLEFWKELPDRDEVLERVYNFLKKLSRKIPDEAVNIVMVGDMKQFLDSLHTALKATLSHIVDDEEFYDYESKNLSLEIDDPFEMDERHIEPEFSGKAYTLGKGEAMSVKIGLKGNVTPVRVHFELIEHDELYYLRLIGITGK